MDVIWDEDKNLWLQLNRDISFEVITDKILHKQYIDILENPARDEQLIFIMELNNYTWVVPFLVNDEDEIVLKTAYPSRRYHKIYGGK